MLETAGAGEDEIRYGLAVASIVAGLGLDEEARVAAMLRYGGAAQTVAAPVLVEALGRRVDELVGAVERLDSVAERRAEEGADPLRAERLRRLLLAVVRDVRVVLIALAERLQALRERDRLDPAQLRRLAARALHVYAPLASRLGVWHLKWEMEDRAFRALEPDAYADIARRLDARRTDREHYIDAVLAELRRSIAQAGITAELHGRPKHIYSIWRKMRRKNVGFDQLFDLRAVRVLVDDVPDCYAVLGIVHTHWPHVHREFDDYIANPKPNGYRSLHTAVVGPAGKVLEVQIRTHAMHAESELGIAAHWRYKEGSQGRDQRLDERIRWMRGLLEWRDAADDTRSMVDEFDSELTDDRVFVFTPRGDIVDLQAGATALDFAYQVHTEIGHRCRGAKVNGAIVTLNRSLESGDQVEVLTARQPRPSRDWLNPHLGYLRTPRARAKVRAWFKHRDYARNVSDGHELYTREVRRLGLHRVDTSALLKRFNLSAPDALYAALGRGDVSVGQLAGALQHQTVPPPKLPPARPRPSPRRHGDSGVHIQGVGNLLVQISRCCRPVPPDPIVGYITRGRGVSIHRQDCGNMLRLALDERARLIDVSWDDQGAGTETYPVDVTVEAFDRKGLLRDITQVIANEGVNVVGLESHGDKDGQRVIAHIGVEVETLAHLSRVLDKLTQLPNVIEAQRRG